MSTPVQSNHLHDALLDLATTADQLGARAASLDELDASSVLFILADELRAMAHLVKDTAADEATYQLLDAGRWRISSAGLHFDDMERTPAVEPLTACGGVN